LTFLIRLIPLNFSTIFDVKQAVWTSGSANTVRPRQRLTLTFDCLTLKLVCESHLRQGIFLPNLSMLGLSVPELFAMYMTDGQTDAMFIAFFPTVGGWSC